MTTNPLYYMYFILRQHIQRWSLLRLVPAPIGAHKFHLSVFLWNLGGTHTNTGRIYKLHVDVVLDQIQTQDPGFAGHQC